MNDKKIFRLVLLLSALVLAAIVLLNRNVFPAPEHVPAWVYKLPALNATINATCSLLLVLSFYYIKQKNFLMHKKLNITAFVLSCMFLLSYLTYHWMAEETTFPKDHALRPLYVFVLVSHIVFSAVVLPLILLSFYYGLANERIKHKKITRISFPLWLYVTISGVAVYFMISPFYQR